MSLKSLKEYFGKNGKQSFKKDIKAEVNPTPTPAGSERIMFISSNKCNI